MAKKIKKGRKSRSVKLRERRKNEKVEKYGRNDFSSKIADRLFALKAGKNMLQ